MGKLSLQERAKADACVRRKTGRRMFGFLSYLAILALICMIGATEKTEMVRADEAGPLTVVTDKEVYGGSDKVCLTITVTNTKEETISDVNVSIQWPAGMVCASAEDELLIIDELAPGESKSFEVIGQQKWNPLLLVMGIALLLIIAAAVVVFVLFKGRKPKTVVATAVFAAMMLTMIPTQFLAGETHTVEKSITIGGREEKIVVGVSFSEYYLSRISRVSVHDPSVVYDEENEMYYIFGSHNAWAKSSDLINWSSFKNNINTDFRKLFADAIEWSAKGSEDYNPSGNMWAPDVIYNESMGKWTMYMSINGDYWYSSIVLLTADSLEGDWKVEGTVVYSGFQNKAEAEETDFYDVYQGSDFPERYTRTKNQNRIYGMNAIDPCVFYDEEGRLWMAYGSWFGGIYMIELDPATGLRLASHTYETVENESDEYQGIKIAGGHCVSGEGAYIEYVDGYYYLYISYGGLTSNGGYNMRVFRSEEPTGPYTDMTGDTPLATYGHDNINGEAGVRVMGNYKWDFTMAGQVAQGHNSVFSDENGTFVVYHTRFSNQGEIHSVRVHQQFVNEDGWLVTAPFEYTGENLCYVDTDAVVGSYKAIEHKLRVNYSNKKCNETEDIKINADGTISGAMEGTWKFSEKLGSPYVTMVIDDIEYNGVFLKQRRENATDIVMTFTILGDNEINIWGYQPIEK